jgi:type I restriction enzyme, S subunit
MSSASTPTAAPTRPRPKRKDMSELSRKSGWQTCRFDQIAINVNERVEPGDTDLEYYVGLEHLDSDSLKIRRWGKPDDVEATKLRFRKGDIIFGRRRVYQRKLAVADFDGICSAHAMVLRPNPDVVLPEFLPFFMQSDLFMDRALEISVGSLSPTINWRTLAAQEFPLPPPDEQRRLAEVLWSAERFIEELSLTGVSAGRLHTASMESFLSHITHKVAFRELLLDASYGSSMRANIEGKGIPILRIPNVLRNEIDMSDLKWVKLTQDEIKRYSVKDGDILIVRTNGNPDYVGRCVVATKPIEPLVFASYLIRLRVDKQLVEPQYITTVLNTPTSRQQLRASVRSSVREALIRLNPTIAAQPDRADEVLYKLRAIVSPCAPMA